MQLFTGKTKNSHWNSTSLNIYGSVGLFRWTWLQLVKIFFPWEFEQLSGSPRKSSSSGETGAYSCGHVALFAPWQYFFLVKKISNTTLDLLTPGNKYNKKIQKETSSQQLDGLYFGKHHFQITWKTNPLTQCYDQKWHPSGDKVMTTSPGSAMAEFQGNGCRLLVDGSAQMGSFKGL